MERINPFIQKVGLTVVALVLTTIHLVAQAKIASRTVSSSDLNSFQSFESGDTVFITYIEQNQASLQENRRGLQVLPDGSSIDLYFSNITDAYFCGFENAEGSYYYYVNENNKDHLIRALYITGNQQKILSNFILFKEEIIGIINDHGISVVTLDREQNAILVYKINRLKVKEVSTYFLPIKFSKPASKIRLITHSTGTIGEANSKVKLYIDKEMLCMTVETIHKTDFFYLKKGQVATLIPIPPNGKLSESAFYCDSMLFKLSFDKRKFDLYQYSVANGSLMFHNEYSVDKASEQKNIYIHYEKTNSVSNEKMSKLTNLLFWNPYPIISVQKFENKQYCLIVGNHNKDVSGFGGVATPAMFLVYATTSALKAAQNNIGEDRYFYASTVDGKTVFFDKSIKSIFKTIDDFCLNHGNAGNLVGKIVSDPKKAYLIYNDPSTMTIDVIKVFN